MSHEVHEVFCRMDSREYPLPKGEVVRLEIVRLAFGQPSLVPGIQLDGESLGDALGDFALDGENVAFLFVKRLGPKVGLGAGVDQFDDHTKLTGGLPDATGDDGFDLKRLADGPGIVGLFLKSRAVLDHQVRGHREHGLDLLVHAFGEKTVLLLWADIAERHEGDPLGRAISGAYFG